MRLAGEAGLLVANVELDEIGGRSVLIVERFDRRVVNGVVTRIHQEDGCQALGLDPEREKYQKPGQLRPSYEALAHVLSSHAVNPVAQLRALGECMVLTAAVANTDGHARNHSFLIEDGALTFAPIYDVAPTMAFVPADTVALAVAGEKKMARITRLRLAVEMQSWGLTGAEAKIVVNDTIDRVLDALNHVDPSSAPTRSVEAINNRARSLNAS
jgi:serine/threonine-protein kinase HipA